MVKFVKPGMQEPYRVMASAAIRQAIAEAGIRPDQVQQAYGAFIYGESAGAQHVMYDTMMTGIPIINVSNNCSSGSTALFLARQAVQSGAAEPGALKSHWSDRESPAGHYSSLLDDKGYPPGPDAIRQFGAAGSFYMDRYGVRSDIFAKVAVKTRGHATRNPYALLTTPLTVEEVLASKVVYMDYLTRLMCCPPSCGAAAAVICSEQFARRYRISDAIEIIGQAMATDLPVAMENPIELVGSDASRRAAAQAYDEAGLGPDDFQLVELHDCFTTNEVINYEALGFCGEGEAIRIVEDGDNTYGGKIVVNPSGGLMSKGHPIGATGIAQCFELCNQLRNNAGQRQVPGARVALQHNIGVPGAAVVTIYRAQ
jgi:acetyl-CoA acetyltransferase